MRYRPGGQVSNNLHLLALSKSLVYVNDLLMEQRAMLTVLSLKLTAPSSF
jgi:hypothetical protein